MNFLKPEHLIMRKSRYTQNLFIPVTEKFAFARKVLKVKIEDVVFSGLIVSMETGYANTCILLIMI